MKANKISLIENKQNIIQKISEYIKKKADKNPYINNYIVGENSLDKNIKESYQKIGVSHLLALSGTHIALLIGLFKKIRKEKFVIPILLLYIIITNFNISLTRASLFYLFGYFTGQKDIKSLIFIALIFLAINPYVIYSLSFQYSFTITLFLIIKQKEMKKQNYIISILKISILCFFVSLPITIYNFNEVNYLSVIYNIIYVPIFSIIIFPLAILSFFFNFLIPILAYITKIIEIVTYNLSLIDTYLILKTPKMYQLLIYYLIIILIKKDKYIYLIILILIQYNIKKIDNGLYVTLIDVEQGDSALIELPNNSGNILIDTGGRPNSTYLYTKNLTLPYIKSRGIKQLDYLILTHSHFDHIGEYKYILENFTVKNIIINTYHDTDIEKEILNKYPDITLKLAKKEIKIKDSTLSFLNEGKYNDENEDSIILLIESKQKKLLFMADASALNEKDLLKNKMIDNINLLKVGHHGSKTSSTNLFLKKTMPDINVISVGKNFYGHPNNEVIERFKNIGKTLLRTDINGSIRINYNKFTKIETISH